MGCNWKRSAICLHDMAIYFTSGISIPAVGDTWPRLVSTDTGRRQPDRPGCAGLSIWKLTNRIPNSPQQAVSDAPQTIVVQITGAASSGLYPANSVYYDGTAGKPVQHGHQGD
jgi:hypothetical protein